MTTEAPERINDQSCDEEREGKQRKHEVTEFVVLAVLGHLCKLLQNNTILQLPVDIWCSSINANIITILPKEIILIII